MPKKLPRLIYKEDRFLYFAGKIETDEKERPMFINSGQPLISRGSLLKNKNTVASILDEYKKAKLIKKCAKLNINQNKAGIFYPDCYACSLNWENYKFQSQPFGEQFNGEILGGCPHNCNFYLPIWKKKLLTIIDQVTSFIKKSWREFNKQPLIIQIIIWLILLSYVAYKPLVSALKIIYRLKS